MRSRLSAMRVKTMQTVLDLGPADTELDPHERRVILRRRA